MGPPRVSTPACGCLRWHRRVPAKLGACAHVRAGRMQWCTPSGSIWAVQRPPACGVPPRRRGRQLLSPCLGICPCRAAGIIPADPAQLAKARLWADLWGAYVGPAQVRRNPYMRASLVRLSRQQAPCLAARTAGLPLLRPTHVQPARLPARSASFCPLVFYQLCCARCVPCCVCCACCADRHPAGRHQGQGGRGNRENGGRAQGGCMPPRVGPLAKCLPCAARPAAAPQQPAPSLGPEIWRGCPIETTAPPSLFALFCPVFWQVMDGFLRSQGSSAGGAFFLGDRYSIAEAGACCAAAPAAPAAPAVPAARGGLGKGARLRQRRRPPSPPLPRR